MIRTQIQLTERQSRRLRTKADQQGVSMAELIRRAVDRALDEDVVPDQQEIRRRAIAAVKEPFPDTTSDVSEHHDRYLAEAFGA